MERQAGRVAIPKRFSVPMREIWMLQTRFGFRQGKRPQRTLAHPRFRAAYDFLALRAAAGEADQEAVDWWTEYQVSGNQGAAKRPSDDASANSRRRRRRRRKPRKDANP
jgi:poly(A) polymerase